MSAFCQLLLFFQDVPLSCLFEPLTVAGSRLTDVFCVQAHGVWKQIHTVLYVKLKLAAMVTNSWLLDDAIEARLRLHPSCHLQLSAAGG
jgi:hypothetical protein